VEVRARVHAVGHAGGNDGQGGRRPLSTEILPGEQPGITSGSSSSVSFRAACGRAGTGTSSGGRRSTRSGPGTWPRAPGSIPGR
jgi:hypothetical protein